MFASGFPSGIAFALASRVGDTSHDEGALHMLALVAALHGGEICDLELQRRAVDALLVIREKHGLQREEIEAKVDEAFREFSYGLREPVEVAA